MPVFEYVLLALLGSGATAAAPPSTTLSADAILQPNGGALSALSIGQEPPKKEGSRSRESRRHRHRRHKHRRYSGKKK